MTRCLHEKEGPERSQRLETGPDTPLSLARQGLLSCELLSTQAAGDIAIVHCTQPYSIIQNVSPGGTVW
jgi:hypothetical protein